MVHALPFLRTGKVPVVADHLREQFVDPIADPATGVDTIGDVTDRRLAHREGRPQRPEHFPRHLAVELSYPICAGRDA